MSQNEETNEKRKQRNALAHYSGLGFQMIAIIGLGTWVGTRLDANNNREFPLFTLIGSLLSVFIALYLVLRDVIKNNS